MKIRNYLISACQKCMFADLCLLYAQTLTHCPISQLVCRPQDMIDFCLVLKASSLWLQLHPSYQTGYYMYTATSLFFYFVFFSHCFSCHRQAHILTKLTELKGRDSCVRQCRCAWGYLGLWSAPLPGTRNSTVSSLEKSDRLRLKTRVKEIL